MWQILLHPNVDKFLGNLDTKLRDRIKQKLKELMVEPFVYLEHYEGDDYYKLRIGEYRALIDVDFDKKLLKVQVLDHRKRIYKA